MKIALVGTVDYPSGLGVYAENIVREWRREGHEVWCLADEVPREHLRGEFPADYTIRCWEPGSGFGRLGHVLEAIRPDVVSLQYEISFCPDPELWDALLRRAGAVCPTVVTCHSWTRDPRGPMHNRRADGVILTNPLAWDAAREEGWEGWRAWFVPHATVRPLSPPLAEPNHRLVTWGFLSPTKGYGEALDALKLLLPEFPDATLTIHGALLPARAEDQVRYLRGHLLPGIWNRGLGSRVRVLLGWPSEPDLQALIAEHSVCWLIYHHTDEVWCSSACLQSGWSACRPVICSKAPHFDVTSDLASLVHHTDDVKEVAAQTAALWRDPGEYDALCVRIREHAESRGQSELARDYLAVFEAVLAGRRVEPELSPEDAV